MATWDEARVSRTGGDPFSGRRVDAGGQGEQGVAAQPAAQGLETDDVAGGDVAEVDAGAERGDQLHLQVLGRRLEHHLARVEAGDDRVEDVPAEGAVGLGDAAAAALPG